MKPMLLWLLALLGYLPEEIHWLSNTTLLLKKKMWTGKNPGSTFAYVKLTIH